MIPHLQTHRLLLRPLELTDAAQIQPLFAHWDIVEFMSTVIPWPYPEDGAITYTRDIALPAMARGDEWHWTLRLKTDPDQVIGVITLRKRENGNRGFWLGLPWQGQGLMTEATDTVTDFWFNDLGFPELRVAKAVGNAASRRVSEKNGMHVIHTEERDYVSGRFTSEIWAITAEEWRRHRATQPPP